MKGRKTTTGAVFLLVLGVVASSALAGGLTTPPGTSSDGIDWSQLGPSNTDVIAPQEVMTSGTMSVNVTSAGTGFVRLDQNNGWNGNFFTGTKLLATDNTGPDISLTFDFTAEWAGAQIQARAPGPFTAEITVNGMSTFTEAGDSNAAADGSAIFIGWLGPITSLKFTLASAVDLPDEFAIGPVYIGPESTESGVVPEASTWAMLLAGFGALGLVGYRRARKAAIG